MPNISKITSASQIKIGDKVFVEATVTKNDETSIRVLPRNGRDDVYLPSIASTSFFTEDPAEPVVVAKPTFKVNDPVTLVRNGLRHPGFVISCVVESSPAPVKIVSPASSSLWDWVAESELELERP